MKLTSLLALFFLLSAGISAQSSLPDKPGTIFWKVTSPSGSVSYILGTFNSNAEKLVYSIPDWDSLVGSSNLVITSWEAKPPVARVEDIRLEPYCYTDLFNARQLERLDSMIPKFNYDRPGMYVAYHPLMNVATHIIVHLMMEMNPIASFTENGMEHIVSRMAKYRKVPVLALDSGMVVTRIDFSDIGGNPHDYNHNTRMVNFIDDLIEAAIPAAKYRPVKSEHWPQEVVYHFNDTAAYTALPELKHLLTERNEYWMPQLRRNLSGTACFVLLGIEHLKYKDGIIKQLIASGFEVSPIAMNLK